MPRDVVRTELDPAARLDICGESSSSSSRCRFRVRGSVFVSGRLRIASIISCGSGGRLFFFAPGLWSYHVLLGTSFPWQMRQRHSRRGLGLAIRRGSRRDGGRRGGVDTLAASGVDGGLRNFEKKQNLAQFTRGATVRLQLY